MSNENKVVLPETVPTPCRSMFATQREYADAMAQHRKNWAEIEAERALLATGGQAQAVASIYVTEDGQREVDDWRVPLPAGSNLLYTAPQAQADARDAERWRAARDGVKSGDREIYVYSTKHGFGTKLLGSVADTDIDAAIAAAKGE